MVYLNRLYLSYFFIEIDLNDKIIYMYNLNIILILLSFYKSNYFYDIDIVNVKKKL